MRVQRILAVTALVITLGCVAPLASAHASATPNDPVDLIQSLASDLVLPPSENVTLSHGAGSSAVDDAPGGNIVVTSSEYDASVDVALSATATQKRTDRDGYITYSSPDEAFSTAIRPTATGAQIFFSAAGVEELDDMDVSFHVKSHLQNEDGSLYLFLEDGQTIFVEKPWARDSSGADLATHFEIADDSIRQIIDEPSRVQFPLVADPAWSYTRDYGIGTTTPGVAKKVLHGCFNCYFPVPGAPRDFPAPGGDLPLYLATMNLHCTFNQERTGLFPDEPTYSFMFDAAEGHVDGIGSRITFAFFKKPGEGTYTLSVYGYIINDNPGGLGKSPYLVGATAQWAIFQHNMTDISIMS